jgi:plastocyanin
LEERVTTLTFAEAGEYRYICHLPGHEAYGMVGVVRVVE